MYSQNNEQQIIETHFGNHIGSFIDIGANDGTTISNTYALYLKGWKGVNVEASPKAFERLSANQPDSLSINCAAGASDGKIILQESGQLLGKGDVALVSSTVKEENDRWASLNMPFTLVEVDLRSWKSICEVIAQSGRELKFDLFCIDIEGMELDVLPQVDFNSLGTSMVVIEWNGKNIDKFDAIMKPQGFRLHASNAENLIYIKRGTGGMLSV